jgi:hypothetical protein
MKQISSLLYLAAVVWGLSFGETPGARAAQFDLPTPDCSGAFGSNVTVLPNGNFVVTDPAYHASGPILDAGAVYLYDGVTLTVISILTGSTANDLVGSGGVRVLSNGNFVVISTNWNGGRGAVTWGNGTTGVTGTVSSSNSLVGSAAGDQIGSPGVTALNNGNYVVTSTNWNGGRGAATWGNGTTGVTGVVSSANSLVGSTAGDQIGKHGVTALNNGNYVVRSLFWNNSGVANAGAATWGSGTAGVKGAVSSANSLVGSTANDEVGLSGVTALNNGNYVVCSYQWANGAVAQVGAVTWGSGTSGVKGTISSANSLIGSTANDRIGISGATVLNNGNYVVNSTQWHNGAVVAAGAVTWGNGLGGTVGTVSAANSLVGSTTSDQVGFNGVVALNNGNYVVKSSTWDNGAVADAGAATWGSGTTGVSGAISAANSLVGSTAGDQVGQVVTALNNGNYVVCVGSWDNGAVANVGAVTWGNGTTGVKGTISSANSLVGSVANDSVGNGFVTPLNNGNYVVISVSWQNGASLAAGAVTWGNGTTGAKGAVSAANSLVATNPSCSLGSGGVAALSNGNYVVMSPLWDNGAVADAGAATWGNGLSGTVGPVSAANSLVGSTAGDEIGSGGVTALNNGNYVVSSPLWNNGAVVDASAVTWGNGSGGTVGAVAASNSLVGSTASDSLGSGGVVALSNGNYVVNSPLWNNGGVADAGAVTWGSGAAGVKGAVSAANSLVGSTASDSIGSGGVTALSDGNYVVRSPIWDNGAVLDAGAVTLGNGTLGTTGVVAAANSVRGPAASGGASMNFAYDPLSTRAIIGYPADNRVSLFGYNPEIVVEQPLNVSLADGDTRILGAPLGSSALLTFTIKNINVADLTGLGITIDGANASQFAIASSPTAPVSGPFGSTSFTLRFTPTSTGPKTAALHIANNDANENPFDINLSGQVLSATQDTDGDGLNDVAEFQLAALGFDWQVSQPGLVAALFAGANSAGLYTSNQLQALNVDSPLLQKNPTNGLFTLTIGVEKSTNLVDFLPFPMTAPQTTINGLGQLEFQFSVPDDVAFFRLESQ